MKRQVIFVVHLKLQHNPIDWLSRHNLLVYAFTSLVQLHAQKCACVCVIYDGMRICALKPVQACLCMPSVCNNSYIHAALPIYRLTNLWYPCGSRSWRAHKCRPRRFVLPQDWKSDSYPQPFANVTQLPVLSAHNKMCSMFALFHQFISILRYNIMSHHRKSLTLPSPAGNCESCHEHVWESTQTYAH